MKKTVAALALWAACVSTCPPARAVGTLMAQTPYGGLLPCHRVVSSTGMG